MPPLQPTLIAINPVIAERADDFEDWLRTIVVPAVREYRPGQEGRWEVLRATEQEDGTVTFAFIFHGGDAAEWSLAQWLSTAPASEAVRHERIDTVIESTTLRCMYELRTEHDFSHLPREVSIGSPASLLATLISRLAARQPIAGYLAGLIVTVPVVVRMVFRGGSTLTGRIGRHSTAGLAVVAAAPLALAQLDQGVGRSQAQLRREGGVIAGPVRPQGSSAWFRSRFLTRLRHDQDGTRMRS